MQYLMKEGILYNSESHTALVRMKSAIIGSQKSIYEMSGNMLLETCIKNHDDSGDVRKHEYLMTKKDGKIVGTAHPDYAKGDEPDVTGWPICRMPRVDHASVTVLGRKYMLIMHNNQNYSLSDTNSFEELSIMHKGISGGWLLEEHCNLPPEIICGIFAFCRYIEQENEFLTV